MTRKQIVSAVVSRRKTAYRVNVQIDEEYAGELEPKLIREAARAALRHQATGPGALTVAVSGDEVLRRLNREFLGQDEATDVLSFPSEADDPDSAGRYFGDIAISYPRALAQAQAGGHSVAAELRLLIVHGLLHLLGHDHDLPEIKARMWQAQAEILAALGGEIASPTDE